MNGGFCSYLALLIFSGIHVVSSDGLQRLPTCVYYHSNAARLSVLQGDEKPYTQLSSVSDDQGRQVNVTTCRKSTDFCYTFWKDDGENNTSTVISQGCWESSNQVDCNRSECLSTNKSSKVLFQSRFCCCSGYLCNIRMAVDSVLDTEFIGAAVQTHDSLSQTAVPSAASQGAPVEVVVIVVISVAIVVAVVVTAVFVFQTCVRAKLIKASTISARNSAENQSRPLIGEQWMNSLKLSEIIGQGRYGTVWKASMGDNSIAVKVFNATSRCYYYNEREVYLLPFLEHPNIIKYLGSEEAILDGHTEFRLILEYAPLGCLQDYLRHNSVDWSTLCKMGRSIARGLAHLHTDFPRGDRMKLCIAHRDLNSRNVLVKADLTCCLCDLGFAMQMSGAHYYYNGEEQHAETTSLCDVGTLRYMSPEVLEGAVNLRECESSLKQIDVYSLGLVLWEIAYRCHDLYPTKEAPHYLLPFEEETGPHPTLEQMKTLVCRHKARPILPDSWRDHSASVRLLKATLEDAWDQDAEARLTSLCVEERWAELPVLWERERHKGFSPTLHTNPCNLVHPDPNHGHSSPYLHPPSSHPHLRLDSSTPRDGALSNLAHGCNSSSTIEAAAATNFKNSLGAWPPSPRPLQPHQGRNPCMERNTCTQSEELSVSGNALVDRSTKHLRVDITTSARSESASVDGPSSSSGYLNYSRVVNPIPYVQNAVRDTGSTRTPLNGANTTEEHHGIGKFFSGIFRLNRNKKNCPVSADTEDWEEHQRLCPTLSSPSDVENPHVPATTMIKTNNQFVIPKATEVRWEEQGLPSVSLIKSPNTNIAVENAQAAVCNVAFNESALGSGAKAEAGVGKLQAPSNVQNMAYSPKGTRRQETKSTAISGCDKPSGGTDVTSSEFPNPKSLSTRIAPTNP